MMMAESTSGMLVNFYPTTWRKILEDSHFHTCRCKNLKSHRKFAVTSLVVRIKIKLGEMLNGDSDATIFLFD
jgi:hypothetical protein